MGSSSAESSEHWPVVATRPGYFVKKSPQGYFFFQYSVVLLPERDALQFKELSFNRKQALSGSEHVVRLLRVEEKTSESACVSYGTRITLLAEAVELLLDRRELSESNVFRVLSEAAEGLSELSLHYGVHYYLTQRMVGVSSCATAKVWLNQDFSKPFPQYPAYSHLTVPEAEHKLLTCLMEIAEKVLAGRPFFGFFKQQQGSLVGLLTFRSTARFFKGLSRADSSSVHSLASDSLTVRTQQDVTHLKSFSLAGTDRQQDLRSCQLSPKVHKFRRNILTAADFNMI